MGDRVDWGGVLEFASSSADHCKAFLERALRVFFGLLCACNIPFLKAAFFRFLWIEIAFGWLTGFIYIRFSCEI